MATIYIQQENGTSWAMVDLHKGDIIKIRDKIGKVTGFGKNIKKETIVYVHFDKDPEGVERASVDDNIIIIERNMFADEYWYD